MFSNKMNTYALIVLVMGLVLTTTAYAQVEEMQEDTTVAISGMVVDSETQQPVSGIELKIEGTEQTAETDAEGKFSFMELAPGWYTVTATPEGYEEVSKEIELTDAATELKIELIASSTL